jgi:hypothetical protein
VVRSARFAVDTDGMSALPTERPALGPLDDGWVPSVEPDPQSTSPAAPGAAPRHLLPVPPPVPDAVTAAVRALLPAPRTTTPAPRAAATAPVTTGGAAAALPHQPPAALPEAVVVPAPRSPQVEAELRQVALAALRDLAQDT